MNKFSQHIVNQQFRKVYDFLKERDMIRSKSDIAGKLDTYNHVIHNILNGKRSLTVDQLRHLMEEYHINGNFMFGIEPDRMFLHEDIPTETATRDGKQNIVLYPTRIRAGYALPGEDFAVHELPRFSIPGLESPDLKAFEIEGDSMAPTITNGDIVVCESVESGAEVRDNHVYVIVTDVAVAKRVQVIRRAAEHTVLRLHSDNSAVYQPYEVSDSEVREILKVRCRITSYAIV